MLLKKAPEENKEKITTPLKAINSSATESQSPGGDGNTKCSQCGQLNGTTQRFCSSCGASLWQVCLHCSAECGSCETFCGSCGSNLEQLTNDLLEKIEAAIETSRRLRANFDHQEAMCHLRNLPERASPVISPKLAQAKELLAEIVTERESLAAQAEAAAQLAEQHLTRHELGEAIRVLAEIPQPFRNTRMAQMLTQAQSLLDEARQLKSEIAQELESRQLLHLAPRIDRYLTLQPGDQRIRVLAEKLREAVCRKVREAIIRSEYERAFQYLDAVPVSAPSDEVQSLRREVLELLRLHYELRHAPLADRALVGLAERLQSLTPEDFKLAKIRSELAQRIQHVPADIPFFDSNWASAPQRTHVGLPIEWWQGLRRIAPANAETTEVLRKHPGLFFVACGLALQGLQRAAVAVNLMPRPKSNGLLKKLALFAKRPDSHVAWGIDVGAAGIKVVKLHAEGRDQEAKLVACDFVPHRLDLSQPDGDLQRSTIMVESLQTLKARHGISESDFVCINAPKAKTLARSFAIPPAKPAKLAELIQWEMTQQIPMPLDDLTWDYATFENRPGSDQAMPQATRRALTVAMRTRDIRDRLQVFEQVSIPVHAVQPDPVALHNLFSYETMHGVSVADPNRPTTCTCTAILEIGAEASTLVLSSPTNLWFRMVRHGGRDVNQALGKAFKLTHGQAEELKRDLLKAQRVSEVLEVVDPVLGRLVAEIQRTLEAFGKDQPDQEPVRLVVCGGGSAQFGLLRHLRIGPPAAGVSLP